VVVLLPKTQNLLNMRLLLLSFMMLMTMVTYAQKSTLIKNINPRAKELNHSLNTVGDTLILISKRTINKVDIFNKNFEKTFSVKNDTAKIALNSIPVGRFVTEVKFYDKLIVITLLRHEVIDTPVKTEVKNSKKDNMNEKTLISHQQAKGKVLISETKKQKAKPQPTKTVGLYWVVNTINQGISSRKIMRIADKETVANMIKKNKIDLKTKSGKLNNLTVWEVYDTSEFMRLKRQNPDYADAKDADCFNTIPYYKSQTSASSI